jgi:general secretion pathway protein F/type IV pilus assembly protein PilC
LIQAFNQARFVMRHPLLEPIIARAEEKIAQGESIQAAIQDPLIPPLIPRMLGIAEQGGKLPYMMRQIAEIYEEELERALAHFTTVAQPVLLLILGAVIGFVLLSVLLPLTDVSSFAAG